MYTRISILLSLLGLLIRIASSQNCTNPFTVATFNTLQIYFAPYKDQRLDATIDYFNNNLNDLDLICMQELWIPDERNQVISGLNSRYPNSYNAPRFDQGTCDGGCSSDQISRLRSCLNSNNDCFNLNDGQTFFDCIADDCRDVLESIGSRCGTCLQQGSGVFSIFRNLDNCLDDNNNDQTNNQTCYAFNGESDNLLLSKTSFSTTDFLAFNNSPITYTTALYGLVNDPNIGNVHVFCTHLLPADLPIVTYEQEVNLQQSQQLLNWVNSKVGNSGEPIVLLGDFNHGPGFWESNFDFISSQSGYADAYIAEGNRNCTYCQSNPLEMGDTTMIIDHAYIKNLRPVSSTRIGTYYQYNLDRPYESGNDRITLSDHYGVEAALCPGTAPATILASGISVVDNDRIDSSNGNNDESGASLIVFQALIVLVSVIFSF